MTAYIIRRLLLLIPTLFGIMLVNFVVIQAAPGGPIEQVISKYLGTGEEAISRVTGGGGENLNQGESPLAAGGQPKYRGAQGLDPKYIEELERRYGFDKPMYVRFFNMIGDYVTFDFGDSFFRGRKVVDLVLDKMPVSISLGLWTVLLTYLISIPLGIAKAVRDGTRFDFWTSAVIIVGNAIPSFLFAILLIVLLAGPEYLNWFPLAGLHSVDTSGMGFFEKVIDYLWHIALPVLALVIGSFAGLTLLTKNSFLEEVNKQYVVTARAKGLAEKRVLYGHVFRNAMLIVIAGFPSAFIGILFTGALLIEVIFTLDGLGLLGFESAMDRDYPVMFGTLYFFTLLGLLLHLIGDITYTIIDPRIDFETRET